MFKKLIAGGALAAVLVGAGAFVFQAHADQDQQAQAKAVGSTLEVHITNNGNVLVRGAKVTSVSGNTINATTVWGSATFNWAIVTDGNSEFVRRYGGASSISEVSAGDFVSFQGMLNTAVGSPYTVQAKIVKDWSVQKVRATFEGTVQSVNSGNQSFVLATKNRGNLTVSVSSSAQITKGSATSSFADITAGAVLTADGVWDTVANTLAASRIKIKVPVVVQSKTTIEGKVTATSPLVITSNGVNYTVNIATDTSIINSLWLRTTLASFKVGDAIRVYGQVNASGTIDATVIRDTSIKL